MSLGSLHTEGDLERWLADRLDPFGVLIRQLQGFLPFAGEVEGDGVTVAFTVEHGLGTRDVHVSVYQDAAPWPDLGVTVERPSVDEVAVTFGVAPALGDVCRVVVSR